MNNLLHDNVHIEEFKIFFGYFHLNPAKIWQPEKKLLFAGDHEF